MLYPSFLNDWADELNSNLQSSNSCCIALFSANRELLFANSSMNSLFKGEPDKSFINPSFDDILKFDNSKSLVFEGFLTIGDYNSVNSSIWANIYRKEKKVLIIGGVNSIQLLEQNKIMHQLNHEVNKLQRELIKEKHTLENTLTQLNELNKNKDRFISILAHDLKNPIGSISTYLSIIEKNISNYSHDEIKSKIQFITEASQNAYELLDNLLLWSNAQSNKLTFNPDNLNLALLCKHVIENLKLSANNKNITINNLCTDNIFIYAEVYMIETVIRNLISNAIKFTKKNGLIRVFAIENEESVTITIADNGIGMKPETKSKLFNISETVTTIGTDSEKGTGLGLLLCKEFVEKNGGKIWVESKIGRGSEFNFTIPKPINKKSM